MCYTYVLRSKKNNKRYIGFTTKDVESRLSEHNQGSNKWTKQNGPFELVYVQEHESMQEARRFEIFLKSGQGRQCLDELGI